MKKLLALFLALALLGSVALAETVAPANSPSGLQTYPLTEEKVTYTWMLPMQSDATMDENVLMQRIEELTNVNIDFIPVSTASDALATKKTVLWASGDLPDVIGNYLVDDQIVKDYAPYGMILNIAPYIDTCMPNFKAALDAPGNEYARFTLSSVTEDGGIYTMPKMSDTILSSRDCVLINTEWLANLGLEKPSTPEELYDVLVAFRDGDPDGDGDTANEIPLSWSYKAEWFSYGQGSWFGSPLGWMNGILYSDGKVRYAPSEEGWHDWIRFMSKCWAENLIDPETFTADVDVFEAKTIDGQAGVIMCYARYLSVKPEDYDKYEYLLILSDNPGSGTFCCSNPTFEAVRNQCAINANVENPELLLRFMDTFMDPYYGYQMMVGTDGLNLKTNEEGYWVPDESAKPDSFDTYTAWSESLQLKQLPFSTIGYKQTPEGMNDEYNCYADMYEFYGPYFVNDWLPPTLVTMTKEEEDLIALYTTDIVRTEKEYRAAWISGERNVDEDWEGYLAQLEALHLSELLSTYQGYLDRVYAADAELSK